MYSINIQFIWSYLYHITAEVHTVLTSAYSKISSYTYCKSIFPLVTYNVLHWTDKDAGFLCYWLIWDKHTERDIKTKKCDCFDAWKFVGESEDGRCKMNHWSVQYSEPWALLQTRQHSEDKSPDVIASVARSSINTFFFLSWCISPPCNELCSGICLAFLVQIYNQSFNMKHAFPCIW